MFKNFLSNILVQDKEDTSIETPQVDTPVSTSNTSDAQDYVIDAIIYSILELIIGIFGNH